MMTRGVWPIVLFIQTNPENKPKKMSGVISVKRKAISVLSMKSR